MYITPVTAVQTPSVSGSRASLRPAARFRMNTPLESNRLLHPPCARMLSLLSSTVALNARSAVLTSSNAVRAPSVSMKSVPALETKFVYESTPDSLGKTTGGVTGLLDATGAVVSTGAAVSTGKTVPAMETDFVYKSESLGRTTVSYTHLTLPTN